jgi:hypothetical protein
MDNGDPKELGLKRIQIDLTADTARDLEIVIAENGWESEEGLRMILGAGMAAVRAARAQQALTEKGEAAEQIHRLRKRLVETESSLAVTRFQLYEALKTIQNWELSSGATTTQNIGFLGVIQRQKEELDSLNKQLRVQQEELVRLRMQTQKNTQEPLTDAGQKRGWKEKLGWK